MDECAMGRRARRRQYIHGSPMLGDIPGPGVYPTPVDAGKPMAMGELFRDAQMWAKVSRRKPGREASTLREKATA